MNDGVTPTDAPSDLSLMDRLAQRDSAALGLLYDRYSSLVMAVVLRVVRDRGTAEQLTLDVFTELWTKPERFNPARGNPRNYLLLVCRSRAIDLLRKRRSEVGIDGRSEALLQQRADGEVAQPLDATLFKEQRGLIQRALSQLGEGERKAIEMSFFDDLSHSQIAERLDLPLGTVKTRVRRGLLKLRDTLNLLYRGEGGR